MAGPEAASSAACPGGLSGPDANSWSEALKREPGTVLWLRSWLLREVQDRQPTFLGVLECGTASDRPDAEAIRDLLNAWGVTAPVAVLRVRGPGDVECLGAPEVALQDSA